MTRAGHWMQTYTGGQFWPLDPHADEVRITDIAHALGMACRYAGHITRFYSVAEHCVLLADYASPELRPWALLHDASEAYIVDVPRPLKPFLTNYREAEANVMRVICNAFGLPPEMPAAVKEYDDRILHDERAQGMAPTAHDWNLRGLPLGVTLQFWSPEEAKRQFLARFDAIFGVRA